jgi:hypothetical protein
MRRIFVPIALGLLLAAPQAQAQTQTQTQTPGGSGQTLGPRATPGANPFALAPWASLGGSGSSIRDPSQSGMDLAARESDATYIDVYGRKKTPTLGPRTRTDGDAPGWSEAAIPQELPLSNPTNCSNEAYSTVGGQAATGADMIGALGGRC